MQPLMQHLKIAVDALTCTILEKTDNQMEKFESVESGNVQKGERKSTLIGLSLLTLSLLLAASVTTIIYITVTDHHVEVPTQEKKTDTVDAHATLILTNEDGEEITERVEYSGGVAYYYGSDGSFSANDFSKSIYLTRDPTNGICYLLSGVTNEESDDSLRKFLAQSDGNKVDVVTDRMTIKVLDGRISDTTFIPQRALRECNRGYQWIAQVPQTGSASKARSKRQACGETVCSALLVNGRRFISCISKEC